MVIFSNQLFQLRFYRTYSSNTLLIFNVAKKQQLNANVVIAGIFEWYSPHFILYLGENKS